MGKLNFGVFLPFYGYKMPSNPAEQISTLKQIVLKCEKLGYDSVWIDDHLMYKNMPILEAWTTLSALATQTRKIRLGTMVTCNPYRNPALLAKMAATVDILSNGRLDVGIGAGVQKKEHNAYGITFPQTASRIERLGETLEIMKKLWTEQTANFSGKYYKLKNAVCEPKPLQKPHPPLVVGGSGEKLTLKVTAKYADRFDWGFIPTLEEYQHKLFVLERHCKEVGRNFEEIEKSCWPGYQVVIGEDQKSFKAHAEKLMQKGTSLEDFKKTNLAGTPEECREKLAVFEDLGVSYFMLFFSDLPDFANLELFAKTVIKA
ncbi:MAG: TIGR03560 family F420-dependent LLM class oxidoreductase [Candidatus Bathyarchaeota archaeon]|nr:TIGR03560 family F420-dependent LLM class oxidoreductase [Candidatus Bathyarchaeota archaeon]